MDENPAGTPNPLSPTIPSGPIISTPVAGRPQNTETPVEGTPVQNKPKTPIIMAIIILILLIIGAGVTAILVLNPFASHDAVPAAISKLLTSGAPENVKMSGSIVTFDNGKDATSPNLSIDFSSEINTRTSENTASAVVSATLPGNATTFNFDISELHTANGDLYLKLKGVSMLTALSAVFETIDDEWIRIEGSDFNSIESILPDNIAATCLVNAAGNLGQYGANFVSLYNKSPFVEYATDNINIDAKKGQLYRLSFNSTKLTEFVNSLNGSGFANELMACMDATAVNENLTDEAVAEVIKNIPTIYVEIDDKDNFTRVYLSSTSEDGLSGAVADISFEYPATTIKVEEPEYHITLGDFLAQILSDFYGENIIEGEAES